MRPVITRWACALVLATAGLARADPYDLRLYRLGNPTPDAARYDPAANQNFAAFTRTFGAALSGVTLAPPETLGHAAFALNLELGVVRLPADVLVPMQTADQPGTVLVPSVHVRKGLPFSIELGGRAAWVEKSHLAALTGEVKWAFTEGFTWLPAVGARAHVTRLLGNRDFELTTAGLDLGVGKQFGVGGMVTLTPYGGLDFVGVAARSNRVDFRPEREFSDTTSGPAAALADTAAYAPIDLLDQVHTRAYGGARFIGGPIQLGVEASAALLGSVEDRSLPAVLSFNTTLGLDF